MIKLAPALLLAALCGPGDAFQTARPAAARPPTRLSMSNDFDHDYDVEVDRRGRIQNIAPRKLAAAAAAAATIGVSLLGADAAFADKPATEFSEAPTSDAAIGRMAYDGKKPPAPPAAPAAPAAAPPAAPKAGAKTQAKTVAKPSADYDGNEAGAVGPSDGGTQAPIRGFQKMVDRSRLDPKNLPPIDLSRGGVTTIDPKFLGGAAVVGTAVIAIGASNAGQERKERIAEWKAPVTATPYGFGDGQNNPDVESPKKEAAPVAEKAAPAPKKTSPWPTPETKKEEKETPAWKLNTPTPYGIENKGRNPYLTEVLEYCEGSKVTDECAETLKGYLDAVSETGAAPTTDEVEAIAGYLDALGSNAPEGKKGKAGAAFTSYLDALSEGSAPPPSSAKAVKTYLDTLKGTSGSATKAPAVPKKAAKAVLSGGAQTSKPKLGGDISMAEVMKGASVAEATPAGPDLSEFDGRLTSIEGRVSSLEAKVDALPDKVFEKIEAWQAGQEDRLSAEVKKIVDALTPPPAAAAPVAPAAPIVEAAAPAPVVEAAAPEPAAAPAPAAPYTSSFAGAIPDRGFPTAGSAASAPKKGFGFGSGASWVTGKSAVPPSPASEIETKSAPAPVAAEPAVPKKAAGAVLTGGPKTSKPKIGGDISMAALVKGAAPASSFELAGAIPERGFPKAGSAASGPKKGYGFGSGASWKTGGSSPTAQIETVSVPEPASEPAQTAVAQPSPLGAIPERGLPGPGSAASTPKKGYGFGGGASWKTGTPSKGSGYLDNMGP